MQYLAALKHAAQITNKKLCLSQEWRQHSELFKIHAVHAKTSLLTSKPWQGNA